MAATLDIAALLVGVEGQSLERKSLFEGEPGRKSPRDRREVRDDVADGVAAFANADGGVLLLGVEDDGQVTGHGYPRDAVDDILAVPTRRLTPPQSAGFRASVSGAEVLVFDVASSAVPVMVQGDGYPVRVTDTVQKMPADKIAAWKQAGLIESWEARPSPVTSGALDHELLSKAIAGAKLAGASVSDYLVRRRMAEPRGSELPLRRAAELVFAGAPHAIEHPNAGVRIFRVMGTERRTGALHNVEELVRQDGALPKVLESTFATIQPLLRRPSRLRGLRFEEVPEYPQFAWQEAIVNAVAHRDYGDTGRAVEVWLYDDRMEVVSPGGVVDAVEVDKLRAGMRAHASRNPRIVRALVDLGFMREQGEGIPRMFGEMELQFLPRPIIEATARDFTVTLRNTPTITSEIAQWLGSLGPDALSEIQARALVLALARGQVSNSALRDATGVDTLTSSVALRDLRDRGLLQSQGAGAATYYVLGDAVPQGLRNPERGGISTAVEQGPGRSVGGGPALVGGAPALVGGAPATSATAELPDDLRLEIEHLDRRAKPSKLEALILRVCLVRAHGPSELAMLLRRDPQKLAERYLAPMVKRGQLRRTHPDNPSHPDQRYEATQQTLSGGGDK